MELLTIDFDALWKWLGGIVVAFIGWQWTRMDSRVTTLEQNSVRQADVDELKSDVRGIYGRLDEFQSRSEERHNRLTETLIDALGRMPRD